MTIDGINFLKLFKKSGVKETSDKEASKKNSVEPEMTDAEKTALDRIRDSALAGYVLGLMKVTGGLAGAGGMAATLQSCGDISQNQDVDIDMAPILEKLDSMMKILQQNSEQMQQMLEYMQEMNSDNKTLISLVKDIINQNKDITSILNSIDGTTQSIESAIVRIVALLEDANANDQEFLNKLDQIINGQSQSIDKLNQILQANKEQNQLLINMEKLLETLNETDKNIYNTVNDIYNEFQNGNTSHSEMLEQILSAIQNNGNISSEILAAIADLSQKLENGQITESEMLNQIINLLASIDNKLDGLKDAVDQIKTEFPDLAGKIDQFIAAYEQGTMNEQDLLKQILAAMQEVSGGNPEFNTKLDEILAAINQGNMTVSAAMDKVIELLGQIEANTGAILEAINKLATEVGNLNANFENNQEAILDGLGDINDGIGSINGKLDQVISNQEQNNATTLEISQKMDEMYAQLEQINNKTLTIDQVKDMLGPMYDELKQYLDNISGNQITVGDLEAILEAHGTDLTRTNALLETLVSLVSNLDLGGGSAGDNSSALKEIADAIKEFQNQSNANSAQVIANLEAVLERLASMEGSLDAIVTTGNDIKSQLDRAMSSATTYGNRLLDELQNISGNMVNKNTLQVYLDSYTEYLQKAEQARQEQHAVLQAILDNMGQGGNGGGLTIDQLKEIIPNYTDILNEISDKIGNLVTSADLEAFFEDNAVDLSRTNALLETLVSLVSNLDTSGVNSAQLNSTLNEIRQEIQNQKAPTEEQVQTLIDLVKDAQSNTQTRSAGGDYYHQGWRYN